MANIPARYLIELAPQIVPRIRQGGWLGLSGFSPSQVALWTPLLYLVQTSCEWRLTGMSQQHLMASLIGKLQSAAWIADTIYGILIGSLFCAQL